MQICLTVHHHLDRNSGAPGAVIALADAIHAEGYQVDVLSHDDLSKWARGRRALFTFPLLLAWRVISSRNTYDVLDGLSADGWIASLLPRGMRPPVLAVHTQGLEHLLHERFIEDSRRGGPRPSWKYHLFRGSFHLWSINRAIRNADVIFVLNREEKDYLTKRLGISDERIIPTFNGVSDDVLNAPPNPDVMNENVGIAFVGSYIPRKGIAYLMPALSKHLQKFENAFVLMLGTSVPAETILRDLSPSVHQRVRVIERFERRELPNLLRNCQILAMPSLWEGFSLAFVEAMACGLAPVVTRGHAFDEVIRHEENGLLVDRGNSDQIAECLERLQADRQVLARMQVAAANTARQYTWKKAAQIRLNAYRAIIAKKRSDMSLPAPASDL